MCGLIERDLRWIRETLERYPEVERAILFGSRAMGNNKIGSDVDLALAGGEISEQTMIEVNEWLNEIHPLPYEFDLLHYDRISNIRLKEHIDRVGQQLYSRE